jgi:hypothetical protein
MRLIFKTFCIVIVVLLVCGCASQKQVSMPLSLATFNENDVEVSIQLYGNSRVGYFISATFTPLAGFHMYSKDIPLEGVNGLGRPTLLELTANGQMKSLGSLIESVPAEAPNFEPKELLVYPPGVMTLSLPVELPAGNDWVEDVVKVTYMSCSDHGCKAPVVGKLVTVLIPGADMMISGENNE